MDRILQSRHVKVPLLISMCFIVAISISLVSAERIEITIEDFGYGQLVYDIDEWGGFDFFLNGLLPDSNGQIIIWNPPGSGNGTLDMRIGLIEVGPNNPSGYISLIVPWMDTTFTFRCTQPSPPPDGTPFKFVSFVETWSDAYIRSAGSGSSLGWVSTDLASAWAQAQGPHTNPFDYHRDPETGYRRNAAIKSVELVSGSARYTVRFSGETSGSVQDGEGIASAYARTGIIYLSDPDPLGDPEAGDNEYVYSPGPWTMLQIPCRATVKGGDNDTLEYFRPTLNWALSFPLLDEWRRLDNGSDTVTHTIYARSQEDYLGNTGDGLIFGGYGKELPLRNFDFGKKTVTMTFAGAEAGKADIEVFYPATATNHPEGGPEGWHFVGGIALYPIPTPNWFYYYWQAVDSSDDDAIRYADSDTSFYDDGDQYVHIGNMAYQPYTMRCFRLVGGFITFVDALSLRGIHTFVYAAEHELAHKRHYETGIYPQTPDSDRDKLGDDWEGDHHLDPDKPDTTGAYSPDPDNPDLSGDRQCIADIEAYGNPLPRENLWHEDWADTGLQKGPPPFNPMPWRYGSSGTNVSNFNDLLQAIP